MKKVSYGSLYMAFIFLLVGFASFGYFQMKEGESLNEKRDVLSSFDSNGFDGENLKQLSFISSVKVYNVSAVKPNSSVFEYVKGASTQYEYESNSKSVLSDSIHSGSGDGKWYLELERESYHSTSVYFLMAFVMLYWCFFTYWSFMKLYEDKKLTMMWGLTLVFFNLFGYYAYHITSESNG
ncbi:hypothetical protein P4V41_20590 [Fictibacillus nanhaiensis]|uniref:hypothetical protein n=1 Tax=Fictibacillus nanhaiensis TaxID=742169 RepID=UPI002E2227A4|nr:hypothetical protein [Fictibacillus nanhaiensis]